MESTLSHVTVQMVSLKQDVKLMLMIVMGSFVRMVGLVKMKSTLSHVTALMDSLETHVKWILIYVSLL